MDTGFYRSVLNSALTGELHCESSVCPRAISRNSVTFTARLITFEVINFVVSFSSGERVEIS